jgi:hypothetical protein
MGANGYVTQIENAFFCLVSIGRFQETNKFFGIVVCEIKLIASTLMPLLTGKNNPCPNNR